MPWVRPYVRSDGTPVRGHSRWAAGARRETTIFAVVALAVVGFGNGNAPASGGASPRPQSTVHYPIKFDTVDTLKGAAASAAHGVVPDPVPVSRR